MTSVPEPGPWASVWTWPRLLIADRVALVADQAARERIAAALDLEGLETLEADLAVRPWLDGVRIDGRIRAAAVRRCGVSLDTFVESIDEPALVRIVPKGSPNAASADGQEVVVDLDAEDPPDEAAGDSVDLAAYVVEFLALALDPFPRKPGVTFEPPEPTGSISPFAALAKLARPPPET